MSMDQNPPPQTPAPAPTPPPAATPPPATSSNMLLAALGYPIGIIALIVVFTEKEDREVRFHGWNALFWNIGAAVAFVVVFILALVLSNIPIPGMGVLGSLLYLAYPAWLIFSIIFAVNANNRKPVNIPVISDLARKQVGA